jgi:predicted outer membrane repeat protein
MESRQAGPLMGLIVVVLLGIAEMPVRGASTLYVDANTTGLDNGSSWVNAYRYLQDALADANSAPKPVEVRVAQGVYRPDQGRSVTSGDQKAAFRLKDGVSIVGGFAGVHAADPDTRDPNLYATVLSADLKGNDIWQDTTENVPWDVSSSHMDNSETIVDARDSGPTTVLDGVQIKGLWYTEGDRPPAGTMSNISLNGQAGLFISAASPTIRDCLFTENLGSSVKNVNYGSPVFIRCRFARNHFSRAPAIYSAHSDMTISQCTFEDNVSSHHGGAIQTNGGQITITDSAFIYNKARGGGGGAVYNIDGEIRAIRCDFCDNSAGWGGAVATGVPIVLQDCTFCRNTAGSGGAIDGDDLTIECCDFHFNIASGNGGAISDAFGRIANSTFVGNQASMGGALTCFTKYLTLENCILAGNAGQKYGGALYFQGPAVLTIDRCSIQGNQSICGNTFYAVGGRAVIRESIVWDPNAFMVYCGSKLTVSYSDMYAPWDGVGNISIDPNFAQNGYWDPNGAIEDANDDFWVDGDYHLRSQSGRWDPNSQSWVIDDVTSACIDAGDPNSLVGDEPEPNGGRINMGAYGGTSQASMSYVPGSSVDWLSAAMRDDQLAPAAATIAHASRVENKSP